MKKYKTFNKVKVGDILYIIEVSNIGCNFKVTKIREFLDEWCDNENITVYMDLSPLSYTFNKDKSSWHGMIFTTKEEALKSAKKQINHKIKECLEQINIFNDIITNLDVIEFKDTSDTNETISLNTLYEKHYMI